MTVRATAPSPTDVRPVGDGADSGAARLDHRPGRGGAPGWRTVATHAGMETRLLVRNGEQLLVAVVIPLLALIVLDRTALLDGSLVVGQRRIDLALPGVLALGLLSTAFTSTAITTGFDRRYGVLRRLGATPLTRAGLLGGKVLSVGVVALGQVLVLTTAGALLGWRPTTAGRSGVGSGLLLSVLAVAALVPVALLVGGTMRAEATLAVANIVYVLLLGLSAVLVPADRYPAPVATVARLLPSGALAEGLRSVLTGGRLSVAAVAVLVTWSVAASAACVRFFRWD